MLLRCRGAFQNGSGVSEKDELSGFGWVAQRTTCLGAEIEAIGTAAFVRV
jgi:hypothetical protein